MSDFIPQADWSALQLPTYVGDRDVACVGCGYNLRGLATAARCPECATPNWLALVEKRLCVASPEWLNELRQGVKILIIAFVVLGCFSTLAMFFAWQHGPISLAGFGAFAILLFAALWKLSAPNPIENGEDARDWLSAAKWLRRMWVVSAIGALIALGLFKAGGYNGAATTVVFLASPCGISGALALMLLARKMERIAKLAEDRFAEGRINVYRRSFVIAWCMAGFSALLGNLTSAFFCISLPAAVAALGFAALIVLSPTYVADRLDLAAEWARQAREEAESTPVERPFD